jgi:hypothetical protein
LFLVIALVNVHEAFLMGGVAVAVAQDRKSPGLDAGLDARDLADLKAFEHRAALSKQLGATHFIVTEGLPISSWRYESNDPYPFWFAHHEDFLTIFPPSQLKAYIDSASSERIATIVENRCVVLSKYGLKAAWNTNEPAVLPEAFFDAYPELRGPRIDQMNRSRKVYFAPNVDNPEMLRLYAEATKSLLARCPVIDSFNFVTTDAGSGFDWTPGLYPGENGNSNYRDRSIADRVSGFLIAIQHAAKEAGYEIRISLNPIPPREWMIPTFSPDVLENIVRKLPHGLAVEGREGPDGHPFATGMDAISQHRVFYPITGLVLPSFEPQKSQSADSSAPRIYDLGDAASVELIYRLAKATQGIPMRNVAERTAALRAFAVQEVGEAQADNLVDAWADLWQARQNLAVLDFGAMLQFGHVLNRWISRPMVPFPQELTVAETKDYRAFLFQAKGEEQAGNLADIQAMRMYEGWGARLLFQRDVDLTIAKAQHALKLFNTIAAAQADPTAQQRWEMMARRVQALVYLLRSAENMVSYQAQLDRVKTLNNKPEANPVLGVQNGWDRTDLINLARQEMDNTVNLRRLLASSPEPLLDLAPTESEETPMRLGPDLLQQLDHKVRTMNAHWRDYDRLFTLPNP